MTEYIFFLNCIQRFGNFKPNSFRALFDNIASVYFIVSALFPYDDFITVLLPNVKVTEYSENLGCSARRKVTSENRLAHFDSQQPVARHQCRPSSYRS